MKIELDEHIIDVNVIRRPNKKIYMRFKNATELEVSCSRLIPSFEIERVLNTNKDALLKMYLHKYKEEMSEAYFCYLGRKYTKLFDGETKDVYFDGELVVAKDEKVLDKFYQKECLRVFQSEMDRMLPYFHDIPRFTLRVRKMSTRWGVNNRGSMTITLNSDLLKRDMDLLDYVIIHELCHYYEPNHSDRFWAHVEEYYPKYKEARKRLRNPI